LRCVGIVVRTHKSDPEWEFNLHLGMMWAANFRETLHLSSIGQLLPPSLFAEF
jgi:hypothetical protein